MAAETKQKDVYRVVQWCTGRVGTSAMRSVIRDPGLELVGLYVHSASKEGRDAGEMAGLAPNGIKATRDINDVLKLKPDVVLYMQEGYNLDDVCKILESGSNLITTRNEFFNAKCMKPEMRERIEAACKKGNSSVYASGSSPGFATDVMPLALSTIQRRVDSIVIDEFADVPLSCDEHMVFDIMGFGQKPEEFLKRPMGDHADGFVHSINGVADALGLPFDETKVTQEAAAAKQRMQIGNRAIEVGTVAAQRVIVSGMRAGKPFIQFRSNWYCMKDTDPAWDLRDNGWRIVIDGDSAMDVSINFIPKPGMTPVDFGGYTANRPVNSIPAVCQARPGVLTSADLPQIYPNLRPA